MLVYSDQRHATSTPTQQPPNQSLTTSPTESLHKDAPNQESTQGESHMLANMPHVAFVPCIPSRDKGTGPATDHVEEWPFFLTVLIKDFQPFDRSLHGYAGCQCRVVLAVEKWLCPPRR